MQIANIICSVCVAASQTELTDVYRYSMATGYLVMLSFMECIDGLFKKREAYKCTRLLNPRDHMSLSQNQSKDDTSKVN